MFAWTYKNLTTWIVGAIGVAMALYHPIGRSLLDEVFDYVPVFVDGPNFAPFIEAMEFANAWAPIKEFMMIQSGLLGMGLALAVYKTVKSFLPFGK